MANQDHVDPVNPVRICLRPSACVCGKINSVISARSSEAGERMNILSILLILSKEIVCVRLRLNLNSLRPLRLCGEI